MSFVQIGGIVFNSDHIITIEDRGDTTGCVIRMSNSNKFFFGMDKEDVLHLLQGPQFNGEIQINGCNGIDPKEMKDSIETEIRGKCPNLL